MTQTANDIDDLITLYGLEPHPEGGWYKRIYAHCNQIDSPLGERAVSTTILYLLPAGSPNRWHRIDADEMWHHYVGDPLILEMVTSAREEDLERLTLGKDSLTEERPFGLVNARVWQRAHVPPGGSAGFALVGCSVSPGFLFEGWEALEIGVAPWD